MPYCPWCRTPEKAYTPKPESYCPNCVRRFPIERATNEAEFMRGAPKLFDKVKKETLEAWKKAPPPPVGLASPSELMDEEAYKAHITNRDKYEHHRQAQRELKPMSFNLRGLLALLDCNRDPKIFLQAMGRL